MKKIIAFIITFSLMGSTIMAQSTAEKEVASAVETLRKAMIDPDRSVLETLTAKELTYGHSNGRLEDKAAFIDTFVSGKSDFKSIALTEQTITLVDNIALVRHKLHGETNDGGKPGTVNLGILLVWQRQQDQWKLIARQAFKL